MKKIGFNKKYLLAFLVGAIIGLVVLGFIFVIDRSPYNDTFYEKILSIVVAPAQPFISTGNAVMHWYCPTSGAHNDLCRGLGLDNGPLEWIEWTYILSSFPIGYGILAVLAFALWKFFLKKRRIAPN